MVVPPLRTLAASSLLLLAAACGSSAPPPETVAAPPAEGEAAGRGAELFGMHCAVCHGSEGRGDGPAAVHLDPPARDFGTGAFRLVSTRNGVPSDADLIATLRHGMPGSSMPSWDWLEDDDLELLAAHVRGLAAKGMAADLEAAGAEPDEAWETAWKRLQPARALPLVEPAVVSEEVLARGAELYGASCAACHGPDGSGAPSVPAARDFTAGFLLGGAAHDELAARIRCGLPGTVMPATELGDEDLAALIAHVQSLIPSGSTGRYVLERRRFAAHKVAFPVPDRADDSRWDDAAEIEVKLAPLRWHGEAVLSARLAAVHDGRSIALRVRWKDGTRESQLLGDLLAADAVALQLSVSPRPPLFGMGSESHPTNLWYWKSARLEDVAGSLDLLEGGPHRAVDPRFGEVRLDGPVYHPFEGVPPVAVRGDEMTATGVEGARAAERRRDDVQVFPTSNEDGWDVVFVRTLAAPTDRDLAFRAPEPVQVALAVWNGSAGDRGAQKSISIWQELRLLP